MKFHEHGTQQPPVFINTAYPLPSHVVQYQPNQSNVIVQQRAPPVIISNLMPLAIFSLLCCAIIPGAVAILYSSKANRLAQQGDREGALKANEKAKINIIVSIVVGIIALGIIIGLSVYLTNNGYEVTYYYGK
ncbi:trafficking regulator of GLUT4 1 isoform X2 [Octopus bimaculoides]|uniref:trafficking regulator of GLUT4 1 isoform X2 n=1 Tax=Octopus bimaculoides TaxID=37653 RepID=UPI0022E10380|nr:trafficking regulator of GLUT4 1 isoform X2 [Octopus bimaculoides]